MRPSSFPCSTALLGEARELGRAEWLAEVSAEVVEEAERPDPSPWTGWGVVATLGEHERQVLDRLVRWRSGQASAKDRPLHYVLSDGVAVDLARRRPATLEDLRVNRRIPQGLIHRHADEILFEIAEAGRSPATLPAVPTAQQLKLQRVLQVWAEALESATKVAATLALPLGLARRVAVEGPGAITGWRKNFLGAASAKILGRFECAADRCFRGRYHRASAGRCEENFQRAESFSCGSEKVGVTIAQGAL